MSKPSLADLEVVKKPGDKGDYGAGGTEEGLQNLQELFRCTEDPLYFMENFVRVQHPTKGAIPFRLFDYQKRMVLGMHEHRFCILMTARQLGKALALDTPIPTPTGWTTMGEIKVGDTIFGRDGKETKVIFATDVMYDHDCYSIEF